MQRFKKHISVCLLMLFGWLLLPADVLHDAFAGHEDTDDTECLLHHSAWGTHVEKQHTHCGIFNTNTPLYDSPQVTPSVQAIAVLIFLLASRIEATYHHLREIALPSRAPPVCPV